MATTKMTKEQHIQTGQKLKRMVSELQDMLTLPGLSLADRSHFHKSIKSIDMMRCVLEDKMFKDYPNEGLTVGVYYGPCAQD